jgi:branched-chain amino acid transport system ATP-binding protein
VRDRRVSYGAIEALKGISLDLGAGEMVTLIGANGAGKSTTLRAIMGLVPAKAGEIRYRGESTRLVPTFRLVRAGLTLVPEGRAVFANLSVKENLEMGAYARRDRELSTDFGKVFRIFPRLKEREKQTAGTLSGGEQQMLAIGRALMSRPQVLLLDEPSLGLAPILVHTIFEAIEEIHRQGTPVLLVEQNANAALKHSNRAYVLETGCVALEGSSAEVAANPKVKEAYLGE